MTVASVLSNEPLAELVKTAALAGAGFRLSGRAIEVQGASQLPVELDCALQERFAELYSHLGGIALDQPPITLLGLLDVEVILPNTVGEAQVAIAEIEPIPTSIPRRSCTIARD